MTYPSLRLRIQSPQGPLSPAKGKVLFIVLAYGHQPPAQKNAPRLRTPRTQQVWEPPGSAGKGSHVGNDTNTAEGGGPRPLHRTTSERTQLSSGVKSP